MWASIVTGHAGRGRDAVVTRFDAREANRYGDIRCDKHGGSSFFAFGADGSASSDPSHKE